MRKFNLDELEIIDDTPVNEYKRCKKCNTENLLSAKFCIECGNKTLCAQNSLKICYNYNNLFGGSGIANQVVRTVQFEYI